MPLTARPHERFSVRTVRSRGFLRLGSSRSDTPDMRMTTRLRISRLGLLASAFLLMLVGCDGPKASRAATETPPSGVPQLFRQGGGEWIVVDLSQIEGLSVGSVEVVPMPGVLEAVGQV